MDQAYHLLGVIFSSCAILATIGNFMMSLKVFAKSEDVSALEIRMLKECIQRQEYERNLTDTKASIDRVYDKLETVDQRLERRLS